MSELATLLQGVVQERHATRRRNILSSVWVLLLAILTFLVIYPLLTLLLGALTDTNPVVEGFSLAHLSITNFLTVLASPNVAEALFNTLVACGGGTLIAVVIGLAFSWIVVRTNIPFKGFIAAASILPLFAPPLVAGVAWSILGSPKTGLINTMFKWASLDWHVDFYSLTGTLLERSGTYGVVEINGGHKIEATLMQPIAVGEKLRIALRPENIAIGKPYGANGFHARVLDRRYQGTQTVYDIDLFGHRLWRRSSLAPRRATMSAPTRRSPCRATRCGPIATADPCSTSNAIHCLC